MLTSTSVNAVYPLAQKLAEQGLALRPLDQTPLAELIKASLTHAAVVEQAAKGSGITEVASFAGNLVEGSQFASADGTVLHDELMVTVTKIVSDSVVANLHLARNVVNPMIKQVMEDTQAHMDRCQQSSISPLQIVPFYFKPIWDSPILRELVDRYAELPLSPVAVKGLPIQAPDNIASFLATGAGRFDEDVAAFADAVGEDRLRTVWNSLFSVQAAHSLSDVLVPNYENFDAAVIAFLFARRLQQNIPEGLNMSGGEWGDYISSILSQCGRAVCRAFDKRALDARTKTMFIAFPRFDTVGNVFVVGEVYDQFLAAGGSPEVIFGSIHSDRQTQFNALLEGAEGYRRTWKNAFSLLQSQASFGRFNAMVEGLREAMMKQLRELPEEYRQVTGEAYRELLRDRLTHAKAADLENLWLICRKAVCRVIFPHTDAEKILVAIDTSKATHPVLDIREAALLAVVDYVCTWLSKLIVVESVPDTGV